MVHQAQSQCRLSDSTEISSAVWTISYSSGGLCSNFRETPAAPVLMLPIKTWDSRTSPCHGTVLLCYHVILSPPKLGFSSFSPLLRTKDVFLFGGWLLNHASCSDFVSWPCPVGFMAGKPTHYSSHLKFICRAPLWDRYEPKESAQAILWIYS